MKKTKNKLARSKKRADLTFYCVMMAFPLLQFVLMWVGVNFNSILLAFKEYDENLNFVWSLGNFEDVISGFFTDVVIQKSLATSALLWLLTTCINMPLSLLISFYFYKNYKGTRLFKTLLFVPSVVSNVVTITIFYYMVDRGYPLLMKALFNIETVGLLVDNRTQLAAVIFYNLFYGLAGGFLFYTSAMCGIDESISEAAQIDGANNWQEFWHITLPLIFPTVSVFLVTSVSGIFIGDYGLYALFKTSGATQLTSMGYYFTMGIMTWGERKYPYFAAFGLVLTVCVSLIMFPLRALINCLDPMNDRVKKKKKIQRKEAGNK